MFSVLRHHQEDPFNLTDNILQVGKPDDIDGEGILLLHGGEDISPSIYNQTNNHFCNAAKVPSWRDTMEMMMVDRARKMDMPIVGICRGAQLLCAIDGGSLIQHIVGHTGGAHTLVDTRTGELISSNSCHHQMMVPNKYNNILATASSGCMGYTEDNDPIDIKVVPEIVHFPKLRALGIQGHPEWAAGTGFVKYCRSLIQEFVLE